jgi:hypothetical protein
MAIGSLPFVVTSALVLWAVARGRAGKTRRQAADELLLVTFAGLPVMVLSGFWAGLYAAAQMYPSGSLAAGALDVWQFLFVAAIAADVVAMTLALVARRVPPS